VSSSHEAHHSKPLSWVWVFVISAGTVVGTLGVCLASWTIAIVGAAIAVVGTIAALATGIMEDVDEQCSRDLWPVGPRDASYRGGRISA
jgi:hypothetical protein